MERYVRKAELVTVVALEKKIQRNAVQMKNEVSLFNIYKKTVDNLTSMAKVNHLIKNVKNTPEKI